MGALAFGRMDGRDGVKGGRYVVFRIGSIRSYRSGDVRARDLLSVGIFYSTPEVR